MTTMARRDALNILGIDLEIITSEITKQAYRRAAQKYHHDRNPAGLEMMQLVNAAYETLKDFSGRIESNEHETVNTHYGEEINEALNAIMGLNLEIEICGSWVWVSGNTKPHKEKLKEADFKWSSKKIRWYFRPADYKPRPHQAWSMEKIKEVYGSKIVKNEQQKLAQCA
jgi:curved DNA-binding protein CbpA